MCLCVLFLRRYLNLNFTCLFHLTGTPTGKRPLGRQRHGREDNIRINLKEIDINMRNLIDSAQDRDNWRALENVALWFHKTWS